MQLSPQTMEILQNFSAINAGIFIHKGNKLQTAEQKTRSMAAYVTVKEDFPQDFGIYNLSQLLAILSLSKTIPEIEFEKNHLIVSHLAGRSKIKYRFCSEEMLTVPEGKPELPSVDIEFKIEEDDYRWVLTTAKILDATKVAVTSNGKKIFLKTYDPKNDANADQSLEISSLGTGTKYSMVMDRLHFDKLIPGSYEVKISKDGIAYFKSAEKDLEYFIALDEESNYDI